LPLIRDLMADLIVLQGHESHRKGRLITVGVVSQGFWWAAKSRSSKQRHALQK
jgi:hypothetical protein